MSRALTLALTLTDVTFLMYWFVASLSQFGVIEIPPAWMYANYQRPDVVA